jgi:hypothetical protein
VLKPLRHAWAQIDRDVRPLYLALEPYVVFGFVGIAIALQLLVPSSVTSDTNVLLPVVELILLVPVMILSFLSIHRRIGEAPARRITIAFILLMAVATVWSLVTVLDNLLEGRVHDGRELILAGIKLWGTLVIVFGLAYWELDRGGPHARRFEHERYKHLQFPQDQQPDMMGRTWIPTFIDYLYVSVTNSTAFSPTDTMPLTHVAKVLMGSQGILSLLTIGLVAARAVNIL